MTIYQKFRKLNINHAMIGMEQQESQPTYFCTPIGSKIIGWAGVDGIHYCTIRGFGEMIFVISPMNLPEDYVHPIARNFEELLGLLLSCGSMDAIEHVHKWDKTQFEEYVKENQTSHEQTAILNVIKERLDIKPMNDPFSYIKNLQADFDYTKIKYPPEYYDINMNPEAEEQVTEWKVTYDGGFWRNKGRGGKELSVRKIFFWGNERWYIPAIYLCSKGIVVDFCTDTDPESLKAYIDKWELLNKSCKHYSKEHEQQMHSEHPLNVEFDPKIILNGKELRSDHGYSLSWIPKSCLNGEYQVELETKHVLEHYDLDLSRGWSIHRYCFLWATKRVPNIQSLKLTMKRSPIIVPGVHIVSPSVGNTVTITHPITAIEHSLTIHEYEQHKIEQNYLRNENMEYPTHYSVLTYTLSPDIPGRDHMLRDYNDGDRPRIKNPRQEQLTTVSAASIGVIGGADGPTMIALSRGDSVRLHAACSSLYFEPNLNIEWYISFNVKKMDDIEVDLIKRVLQDTKYTL